METTTSLLNQKDFLLIKMKDLLLINDIYNLQKIKKEYDLIVKKLKKRPSLKHIDTNKELQQDPYSNYCMTNLNGKINPRHLKYYKNFKNPVKDHNFLIYEKEVKEKFEDEEEVKNEKTFEYNPVSLDKKLGMINNNKVKSILKPINLLPPPQQKIEITDETYTNLYGNVFIEDQDILEYSFPIEQETNVKSNFEITNEDNIENNFENEYNNEYAEY